ncbi:MAG: hypothetical protein A2V90_02800 [Gammaproteobacteria bacterium RBG_16_57_12]|nr:MAG: hypothetical protein A2V90_02800 [Gammaproteobacteria bacterium RBG_16_57_12]
MKSKILLVDTDSDCLISLSGMLKGTGFEVSAATSAEEALELFSTWHFPVVMTAINLYGRDGIELLKQIKRIDDTSQIIVMNGEATLETAMTALRSGAYDYLVKSRIDEAQVISLVEQALEKHRVAEETQRLLQEMKVNNEKLEKANKCLIEMAIRDGLTGLYNHRFFQECHQTEISRSRRHKRQYSLIFFDIDHFKEYNDTHGHVEGDSLLRIIAQITKGRLRQSDFAYRYGGEEFALLLPETDKQGAYIVAESIRARIAEYAFKGRETQPFGKVTISAGVTTFPDDAMEAEEILDKADKAMYLAKKNGRNRVHAFNIGQMTVAVTSTG